MQAVVSELKEGGLGRLASYVEKPVGNSTTLDSLQARASSFAFKGQDLPVVLIPELTFDMGSRQLNKQMFMSMVDLPKSDSLLRFTSTKLGYQPTPENTGACLVVERKFDFAISQKIQKPAFSYNESLLVVHLDKTGNLSQCLVTPNMLRSVFVRKIDDKRDVEKKRKVFDTLVAQPSSLIRGFNDTAIAWDGKNWGVAEYEHDDGNIILGGRCGSVDTPCGSDETLRTVSFGTFHSAPAVQESLRTGILDSHAEYVDAKTKLVIPGAWHSCSRQGFGSWVVMMAQTDVYAEVGGGSSGGGGAGGGSRVDDTASFSGSGACAAQYTSRDACYGCCDSQGSAVLTTGLAVTTALVTGAAIATAPTVVGILGVIVLGVVGVVGSAVVAYVAADTCKSYCDNTIASLAGSGAGRDGEPIT